jgi:DNA repair protein RadC
VDNNNIHKEHRKRVKENVAKNGFSHLEEHKLLELLLFYSIPRVDTNETAHNLLNEFGSLEEIFKASHYRLKRVDGVGDNTALMLNTIGEIFSRIQTKEPEKKIRYKDVNVLKECCVEMLRGANVEKIILYCFDASWRLKKHSIISDGTETAATIDIAKIVQIVLDTGAPLAVISHNHPEGAAEASAADIDATRNIAVMLRKLGVYLADHVIVGGNGDAYSMYSDPERKVTSKLDNLGKPEIEFAAKDGVVQRLWKIDDEKTVAEIETDFENKNR